MRGAGATSPISRRQTRFMASSFARRMRMRAFQRSAPMRRVRCPALRPCSPDQNWPSDNIGPLPCAVTHIPMTTPLVVPPCHALARDVVRYVGEPIAFVVAESAEIARDAAEAIVVDYEPLPPVVSIADAVLPGALSIWPEAANNIAFQFNRGEIGAGRSSDPRRRPCRGMRAGQQPRRRRAAGNAWCARRVRRRERPSAPDRLGGRRARDPRSARQLAYFVSPEKNCASAFPTSAAASA